VRAEAAIGVDEQQRRTDDQAEHHVGQPERQQVQLADQHQQVDQAGEHEQRAEHDAGRGGGGSPRIAAAMRIAATATDTIASSPYP
jgi:hypothetical protein